MRIIKFTIISIMLMKINISLAKECVYNCYQINSNQQASLKLIPIGGYTRSMNTHCMAILGNKEFQIRSVFGQKTIMSLVDNSIEENNKARSESPGSNGTYSLTAFGLDINCYKNGN